MNSNSNVVSDISKISSSKNKLDSIINDLKDMNNSIMNGFEGNGKMQLVERINRLINECYDLDMEFVSMKNGLFNLSVDIVNEAERQEKLREQKMNR
ncbi:hypothetical protein [Clostridium cibarium]|uniref:Uncharacterized protein n=1 Tax=Clostridium cibarium TaxID=2762247 RepID=A0ABR8PV87_9CLOT|nr:hypothetical protein [Clostridium cibarium]MBD7912081.1 hypothetical protein [Clostridium cibarium]